MSDYAKNLGEVIYRYRKSMKMTQATLAEKTGVTEQTIRKIEHGDGNPQLDVLYALVTTLQIDPSEIFYPGNNQNNQARKMLEILLAECSDNQIASLLPIIRPSSDHSGESGCNYFQSNRLTKKSLLLHLRSSRLCALSVWLVADYDLKFYYAEFGFLLALGTVQRKIK